MDNQEKIIFLEKELKRLRENCGAWRRKAKEKPAKRNTIREGYIEDDNGSYHYKVYLLEDIPADLNYIDVRREIEESFIPKVKPYEFRRFDYSIRYSGWFVEVRKYERMSYVSSILFSKKNDDKI